MREPFFRWARLFYQTILCIKFDIFLSFTLGKIAVYIFESWKFDLYIEYLDLNCYFDTKLSYDEGRTCRAENCLKHPQSPCQNYMRYQSADTLKTSLTRVWPFVRTALCTYLQTTTSNLPASELRKEIETDCFDCHFVVANRYDQTSSLMPFFFLRRALELAFKFYRRHLVFLRPIHSSKSIVVLWV